MSYEKKMKDLMARLVSMSPEPPPYPEEEAPMARQREQRRSRPALVFAAAAALVVVLAVPLLLFSGDGEVGPAATSTTSTVSATSTTVVTNSTTTTVPPATTTTMPTFDSWSGVVFLYHEPVDSFTDNPALVAVAVTIENFLVSEEVDFFQALATLAQTVDELPPGLLTAVPPGVFAKSKQLDGETVVAEMNDAFLDGAGGLLADFTMLNQLIYTLTENDNQRVLFTVDGEPVDQFGTDGLDLTTPVGRGDFREHLHSINLTSPIIEQEGRYTVEGTANVFEATVSIEVLDAGGSVVHEEFATATCGTGCWGEFSTEIDAELIVPGESSIRVFTHSAEDGSPVDVVTVPIPKGDVWQLSAGG